MEVAITVVLNESSVLLYILSYTATTQRYVWNEEYVALNKSITSVLTNVNAGAWF